MLVALNNGYYNTKVKTAYGEAIFPTRAQKNIDAKDYIELDGVKYEVGVGSKDIQNNKENNLVSKLCSLYAISKKANKYEDIKLITALPISQYINSTYRELYMKSFDGKDFNIMHNDTFKKIHIKRCVVYMEGAAAVMARPNEFKNKVVGVIDLGGYTTNNAIFDNMKLVKDSYMSLDLGMYSIERKIADTISQIQGTYIKDYEVKYLIDSNDFLIKEVVNMIIDEHLELLKQSLLEKGWNLKGNLYFTGGGAVRLKEHLINVFGSKIIIYDDCIWDNVRGLYKVGEMI